MHFDTLARCLRSLFRTTSAPTPNPQPQARPAATASLLHIRNYRMTSLALAALLQVSLAVSDTPYEQALKKSEASGRPVLILIGADWCPYCKIVERDVLPKLKAQGLMDKVEYFYM